ncbi:hypothetical protein MEW_01018 [Candida albicans P60002]|nr:hypothetical protein MG7_01010 [Candida albicans P34048]KGU36836.1 hypothetical protein MGK_01008 [Candida albicans P57055]KHC56013.1 hypothetical protein MEW_01018 [Candida albicans P60002]
MSGNDSPIPGNATVKIEQLQSFTSLQSQVTSPQKTMNETNTHFRYLLQNANNETILEVNADMLQHSSRWVTKTGAYHWEEFHPTNSLMRKLI